MKINQTSTSLIPANADKEAHTIVAWKTILDTNVKLASMKRPIVTGIGKILEEVIEVELFEVALLLLLLLLFAMQNPLSSIKGGVHSLTHLTP